MPANCLLVAVIKMFTEMFVKMFIEMLIEIFTEMPIGMFAKSFVERLLRFFGWQPDPTNLRIANSVGHLYHFVSALESESLDLDVSVTSLDFEGSIARYDTSCI